MKWVNHRLIAGATALAASHSVITSVTSIVFAVFPDFIEVHNYQTGKTLLKHRGVSHNMFFWFGFFIAFIIAKGWLNPVLQAHVYPALKYIVPYPGLIVNELFLGIIWGTTIHVITDSMTMGGVPIGFKKIKTKIALKWFYTGSRTEYIVSFAIVAICIVLIVLSHGSIVL